MQLPDDKELKQYDRWNVPRPDHIPHGMTDTPEHPLGDQIPRLKTENWRLEGNRLTCDTEHGEFSQIIDPGYICLGEEDGLPILKKVVM